MNRQDIPRKFRTLYDKAMTGKHRRAAIRINCLWCLGWSEQGVQDCTSRSCPLYHYRLGHVSDSDGSAPHLNGGEGERHGDESGKTASESGGNGSDGLGGSEAALATVGGTTP